MFDGGVELNGLAIIAAALAYYVLGAVWFTPLFGALYDKALDTKRSPNQKWPMLYYIGPLVSAFAASIATALFVDALQIVHLSDALLLGLIVGVGYAMSISFNNAINPKTPRPLLYGAVTGSYHVVGMMLTAAILYWMS
ncbi:DUF1761 domain-containing protein [Paenibacillus xanthanilyticus]|uniref:DUF1761 domain-containing protein n=1 Tax=Paenibacillus xanthanilyticus TaxID=1783531 RepID=A0ABV8KDU5_9BACL